jgi:hypothetical protein
MTFCNGSRGYEFKQDYTSDKLLVETSRHAVSNKLCRGCPVQTWLWFRRSASGVPDETNNAKITRFRAPASNDDIIGLLE